MAGFCATDKGCYNFDQLQSLKNAQLTITKRGDKSACITRDAKNFLATVGVGVYERTNRPDGCVECDSTGTTTVTPLAGAVKLVDNMRIDGIKLADGVVTYWVEVSAAGTYATSYSIGNYGDALNMDVYSRVIVASGPGHYPVTINLTDVPSSVLGTGWLASTNGIHQEVAATAVPTGETIGASSFSYYDDSEELEVNEVYRIECAQSFSSSFEAEITEQACGGSTYNTNNTDHEFTFQGIKASRSPESLMPNTHKVKDATFSSFTETTQTVVSFTDENGAIFGSVQIADVTENCDQAIDMLLKDACGAIAFSQVVLPSQAGSLNAETFQLLDGSQTPANVGRILVDDQYIGKEFCIVYPVSVQADGYVVDTNYEENRVDAEVKVPYISNGKKVTKVINFKNLLIRSVSAELGTDAPEGWTIVATATSGSDGTVYDWFTV